MEVNQISNVGLVREVIDKSLNFLITQNKIDPSKTGEITHEFGYIYTRDDGFVEALFKFTLEDGTIYRMALQENKILLLNLDEETYQDTVTTMKNTHACLRNNDFKETELQIARKQKNNEYLKAHNITFSDKMSCIYEDSQVKLKSLDEICKRAIASLLVIQISCDIRNNRYNESRAFFLPLLEKYDVLNSFNGKELRILSSDYPKDKQDLIDMDWAYEAYWALCWCLGLIDDISDASAICDCDKAIFFVMDPIKNPEKAGLFKKKAPFDTFRDRCHLRSVSEILDMQDLYYRYSWAINEKKINESTSIGNLDSSVVLERRRALEWIISDVDDWYDVNLSA